MTSKRLLAFTAALMLILTSAACDKKAESSSSQGNQTSDEIETLVANMLNAYEEKNFSTFESCFPDFFNTAYEFEAQSYKMTAEQLFLEDCGYYSSTYGSDYKITHEINSTTPFTAEELASGKATISEVFEIAEPNITEGFTVAITETDSGTLKVESVDFELYALRIDDKLYLYLPYYESDSEQ